VPGNGQRLIPLCDTNDKPLLVSLGTIPALRGTSRRGYDPAVTDRARKVLEDAKALSVEERADLAAELLATLPPHAAEELHPEWAAELTRRARRAWADPEGGEPWEEVEQRLLARIRV